MNRKRDDSYENETKKLRFSTKKEVGAQPASCPRMPPKIRKRILTPRTENHTAKPIGCTTVLSTLYNPKLSLAYIDQVFEKRTRIGEGSFGYVYKSRHKGDGKVYAIKYLKETSGSVIEKYREVKNYEKVGLNEHCVAFFGAWEEEDRFYIQMECCAMSLSAYCVQNHLLPERQLWDILIDILLGLKHLHGRNLIHLDIKPENILISDSGIYKLTDFGLLVDLVQLKKDSKRALNFSDGDGKYLACEVLERVYTKACDIFSLGITMMELATDLVLPQNGPLWHQLRQNGLPDEYYQEGITSEFKNMIRHMMAFKYVERPSVDDILQNQRVAKILEERKIHPRMNYLALNNNNESYTQLPVIEVRPPTPTSDCEKLNTPPPNRALLENMQNQYQGLDDDDEIDAVPLSGHQLFTA